MEVTSLEEITAETLETMPLPELIEIYNIGEQEIKNLYIDPVIYSHVLNIRCPTLDISNLEEFIFYLENLKREFDKSYVRFVNFIDSYPNNKLKLYFEYESNGRADNIPIKLINSNILTWGDTVLSIDNMPMEWWGLVDRYLREGYIYAFIHYNENTIPIVDIAGF